MEVRKGIIYTFLIFLVGFLMLTVLCIKLGGKMLCKLGFIIMIVGFLAYLATSIRAVVYFIKLERIEGLILFIPLVVLVILYILTRYSILQNVIYAYVAGLFIYMLMVLQNMGSRKERFLSFILTFLILLILQAIESLL